SSRSNPQLKGAFSCKFSALNSFGRPWNSLSSCYGSCANFVLVMTRLQRHSSRTTTVCTGHDSCYSRLS
ncbi:hypothetical protein V5799_007311, partial [Amblyomma americanum]